MIHVLIKPSNLVANRESRGKMRSSNTSAHVGRRKSGKLAETYYQIDKLAGKQPCGLDIAIYGEGEVRELKVTWSTDMDPELYSLVLLCAVSMLSRCTSSASFPLVHKG